MGCGRWSAARIGQVEWLSTLAGSLVLMSLLRPCLGSVFKIGTVSRPRAHALGVILAEARGMVSMSTRPGLRSWVEGRVRLGGEGGTPTMGAAYE